MSNIELSEPNNRSNQFIKYLIRWNAWIITGTGAIIILIQILENPGFSLEGSSYHYFEIFLFILVLISLSVIIKSLTRTTAANANTTFLLDLRHQLSLKMALAGDIEELSKIILKFPSSIISSTKYTSLFIYYSDSGRFTWAGDWSADGNTQQSLVLTDAGNECHNCIHNPPNQIRPLDACIGYTQSNHYSSIEGFCLPLKIDKELVASLHFALPKGNNLTKQQQDILNNIGTEIAIAVKSAVSQQRLAEIKTTQAALSERNKLFQDLHDVLGQNLGFLHLKLDQFSTGYTHNVTEIPTAELGKMRDVAAISYEIVRGTLNALRSSTAPYLSSLLNHQSRLVAISGKFDYNFSETGQPRPLPPLILHNTYFICKEAINNIARHSGANQVEGKLIWGAQDLTIEISDNGKGFDPSSIDRQGHYGMSIMKERVESLNGCIDIQSVIGSGTKVSICIPLKSDLGFRSN